MLMKPNMTMRMVAMSSSSLSILSLLMLIFLPSLLPQSLLSTMIIFAGNDEHVMRRGTLTCCLTQEIETLTARLEETQNNLSTAQRTTDKLEDAFRQMEREKNEMIQVSDSLELYL